MKLVKKLLAFCFLLFGIPFTAVIMLELMNPKTPVKEKENDIAALTILTVPSTLTALPAIMQYSFSPCPLLSKLSDLRMYLIAAGSAV